MKLTRKRIYPILLGLGISASGGFAQTPGTFAATGNLSTGREWHTATLLQDGRVLIAGGGTGGSLLSSAELYDPSTGVFTLTGKMTTARMGHTATLLADGRVLIAGGSGDHPASAETYDPASGAFTATGDMVYPTSFATASLFANGKVLFTGGFVPPGGLVSPEIYDPATGKFAAAGPYASGGSVCDYCSPAILLADGRVLFSEVQPAQLYNPGTATFSTTGSMIYNAHSAATLLMNGQGLLTGGETDFGRSDSAELFDPAKGAFSLTGNMASRRVGHSSTLLPDGTVLVAGGETDSCSGNACFFAGTVTSAELYHPSTGTFSATGSMTASRELQTATLLKDGRVLFTGGVGYGGIGIFYGNFNTAEIYTPAVLVPAPALFSLSGDGKGQGAIWHTQTGQIASSQNPAVAGEILAMYTTSLFEGGVIPPQISVGGQPADVLFFGAAPGYPGYYQVNFRMPGSVAPGPSVPVRLTYLGRPSNQVTIGVQAPGPISVSGVQNAASGLTGPVAPGEMVVITGSGLGPAQLSSSVPGSDGSFGTQLSGTTVQMNDTHAPVIYTSATLVAAIVPDSVDAGAAQITVTYQGRTSASFPVPVAPTAPGIFTQDSTGQGHATTIDQNGSINTPAHWDGDVVTLFLTGAGHATPAAAIYHGGVHNGSFDSDGLQALPIVQGPVPGVMQFNVPIPWGTDCDVPVVVQVGNASSQPGVKIAIDLCI